MLAVKLVHVKREKLAPASATAAAACTAPETTRKRKRRASSASKLAATKKKSSGWAGPTPAMCARAVEELSSLHGVVNRKTRAKRSVLDSLVGTMLSQNTTDLTSARAFAQLKASFPTWSAVHAAPVDAVADAVRCCGLADIRAERIQGILEILVQEAKARVDAILAELPDCKEEESLRGLSSKGLELEPSLEHLRDLDTDSVKRELLRFKGVGPKTVACVLMFCLERPEFAVDVHVWRIAKRMKWVPPTCSRVQAYQLLNKQVPGELKFQLHVLLVTHGKHCLKCAKNGKPRREVLGPCPLTIGRC